MDGKSPSPGRLEIILMAKPPEEGEAKTRLALDIGDKNAIQIYQRLLQERLEAISRATAHIKSVYTYGSDDFLQEISSRGLNLREDIGSHPLKTKVYDAFRKSLENYDHSLMIVADDPSITRDFLDFVTPRVVSGKLVIGPTRDGGLYLIGVSRRHLPITEDLPFGDDSLCDTLIKRGINRGFSIEVLPQHIDIDSRDDMESYGIIIN